MISKLLKRNTNIIVVILLIVIVTLLFVIFYKMNCKTSIKENFNDNTTTYFNMNEIQKITIDDILPSTEMLQGAIVPYYPPNGNLTNDIKEELKLKGFVVCNGHIFTYNGKSITIPDLRRKFLVGYGDNDGNETEEEPNEYAIGYEGGEEKVILTKEQCALPDHKHSGETSSNGGSHIHRFHVYYTSEDGQGTYDNRVASGKGNTEGSAEWKTNKHKDGKPHEDSGGKHDHSFITSNPFFEDDKNKKNRTVEAHENRPPYFALVYLYYLGDKIKNELKKGATISVSSN